MRIMIQCVLMTFLIQPCLLAQDAAEQAKGVEVKLSENLKLLQPLVGTWAIDMKVGSATPSDEQQLKGKSVYSVGMNGNYLIGKTYLQDGSGTFRQVSHDVWRWDDKIGKVYSHEFSERGKYVAVEQMIEKKDGNLSITSVRAAPRSPVAAKQTFQFIDDDTFSWKVHVASDRPAVDGIYRRQKQE